MVEIKEEVIKEVESDIRDLINFVEIKNREEVEAGTKRIEDPTAEKLKTRLRAIAGKLGIAAI